MVFFRDGEPVRAAWPEAKSATVSNNYPRKYISRSSSIAIECVITRAAGRVRNDALIYIFAL
jgi:hypothetical protein